MKIVVKIILLVFTLIIATSILNSTIAQKRVKASFDITGSDSVKLRVEIEYAFAKKRASDNPCMAQFIVTNIGTVPYKWLGKAKNENQIVFEFTTSDGKVLEVSAPLFVNLQPGNTSGAEIVYVSAGLNRYCKSIRAVRLDSVK